MAKKKFHESKSGFANMPQNVVMKSYPASTYGDVYEGLDDSISGIDYQMKSDSKGKSYKKSSMPERF